MIRKHFGVISVLLGLAAGTIIAEIILSFYIPSLLFHRIDIESNGGQYCLSEINELFYIPVPNSGAFNAYGHRGKVFPFARNQRKRIIFIGDSVVEGLKIDPQHRFTEILGSKLGDMYEIINLGVCGYSFLQEYEYLKLKGLGFSPDIVLWGITCNDFELHSGEAWIFNLKMLKEKRNGFYLDYYGNKNGLGRFLSSTNIGKFAAYTIAGKTQEKLATRAFYKLDRQSVSARLKKIESMATKNNFNVIFVLMPYNIPPEDNIITDFKMLSNSMGFDVIDLRQIMDVQEKPKKSFFLFQGNDPWHFNEAGHILIAETLFNELKSRALLK